MAAADLTAARLRELVHYDTETGVFTAIKPRRGLKTGTTTLGHVDQKGYVALTVAGVRTRAHRLAFLYMEGALPDVKVDHRDGNKANNVWLNLRKAPGGINQQNMRRARMDNRLGVMGVFEKRPGRFVAVISINGKNFRTSVFDTPQQAHEAYVAIKRASHPGFIESDYAQDAKNQASAARASEETRNQGDHATNYAGPPAADHS